MNEEMRKEFERLVVSGDLIPDLFSECVMYANRAKIVAYCFCDGRYHNDFLQSNFEVFNLGWKARGEAMKPIKLPDATFETPSGDSALREDAVLAAIESAGYKVVP